MHDNGTQLHLKYHETKLHIIVLLLHNLSCVLQMLMIQIRLKLT